MYIYMNSWAYWAVWDKDNQELEPLSQSDMFLSRQLCDNTGAELYWPLTFPWIISVAWRGETCSISNCHSSIYKYTDLSYKISKYHEWMGKFSLDNISNVISKITNVFMFQKYNKCLTDFFSLSIVIDEDHLINFMTEESITECTDG